MSSIYVKEQGSMLVKRGERIVVTKGRQTLFEFPAANVEAVAIIGNVQISTQALYMLMEKGIDINYFSFSGKHIGYAAADRSKNIFLRFAQHEYYHDLDMRMNMARIIVGNKIRNQIQILRRHRWDDEYDWHKDVDALEKLRESLDARNTPNSILGVEGMCSNIYFGAYGHMFKDGIKFSGRNRRPPRDPVNVMLSLGYTFLTKEVCMALEAESFEMYLGFLHGIRYGRKSLALDIVEEFRQPVIDRMVLRGFNTNMFTIDHFNIEGDAILLKEEGFIKFCQTFEKWMKDNYYTGDRSNFREFIHRQARRLKQSLQSRSEYLPYSYSESQEDRDAID